ncbi:hypothetical protein SDC9_95645 [bioreactor metagenome]|uniref:Phage replisome organiser N-terminal domain-containing protein n=1 Tax=bioreactor metagenome TaxID=1076179 RepID=A0A645A891_9ZZZZ
MTNTKKYYWLKLKEDFFEEDAIAWIEEQENGKDYCLFYLKLCLKSLKTNGLLIRNVGSMLVPYDAKTLAKVTNTDIDTVKVAMEIFTRIGLVQILENGEIFISQLQHMVGSETSKAQLMRNKRKKDKDLIESSNNVTKKLPSCYSSEENCYTEKEKEKELEKELEIDIDIEPPHIEKEKSMVVEASKIITSYFPLEKNEVVRIIKTLNDSKKDMNYLEEKLNYVKNNPNTRDVVGLLINAIKNDYKSSMSNNSYKKTRFHNFDENFLDGMSEEDFNDLVSGHK